MKFDRKRYCLNFLGCLVALFVLNLVLTALGLGYGGAAAALIPPIIAALIEGQHYARMNNAPLPRPWRTAYRMSLIATGFFAVFIIASFALSIGVDRSAVKTATEGVTVLLTLIVLYNIATLVLSRIFYGWGAKGVWKEQA